MSTQPPLPADQVQAIKNRQAQKTLLLVTSAVNCKLCPNITEQVGLKILQERRHPRRNFTQTAIREAKAMIEDPVWRERFETWVDGFWIAHGHGPSWSRVRITEELWDTGTTESSRRVVLYQLGVQRIIDGSKTPFGLKIRRKES